MGLDLIMADILLGITASPLSGAVAAGLLAALGCWKFKGNFLRGRTPLKGKFRVP